MGTVLVRSGFVRFGARVAGMLVVCAIFSAAQQPSSLRAGSLMQSNPPGTGTGQADSASAAGQQNRRILERERRRAAKLYIDASKRFENGQFERALDEYQQAAALDPSNQDYALASEVARSHAVTALIQAAAKDREHGDAAGARAALQRAGTLDPKNPQVAEHVEELADDMVRYRATPLYEASADDLGQETILEPTSGVHSFHLKGVRRQLIEQVYRAYGISTTFDQSVPASPARFDVDNAEFSEATQALALVTQCIFVPLDGHRVLALRDTRQNRQEFMREEMETIYLPGLTQAEMTEISNVARNVFAIPQVNIEQNAGTITVRGPRKTLNAFNTTLQTLMDGSQVMLNVQIFQLAHTYARNTGVQPPKQITAFNAYTEEQAILNQNQALVQQIISSGLAAPGDTLAILGILLASGAVSNSIFNNGIALFGGGLTLSGISPQPATLNFGLNTSDSRELDDVELRLADGQDETIMSGSRYPILTASFGSGLNSGINIPGLTGAGSSSGLSSLLNTINSAQQTQIPQVQYQNIGLTMKATPKIMRSGDVALTLDLKITALAGSSSNGIPVLNNRSYSGVITLKEGAGAFLLSEIDKQESLALSGTPGLTEIPGLNNVTDKNNQQNYATLLIVLTPHLIREPQMPAGHSPMLRIERTGLAQ